MPGSFLSLNGHTMYMNGSAMYNYKPVLWVTSDNENVKVTGAIYAYGSYVPLTSITAQGGSASAEIPAGANHVKMTASAAPYYATYMSVSGSTGTTMYWVNEHKYGEATSILAPGRDVVLGSYSGQLNTFTARGNFASGSSTGSKGWEVPAKVTALTMSLPTLEGEVSYQRSVSAYTNYMIKEMPWNSTFQSATITQTGLSGTFSSLSGLISQEAMTKRTGSYVGKITYPMIQAGPAFIYDCNCGDGGKNSGTSLISTIKTSTFTADQWTVGSSLTAGNGSTLWIGAYYNGGYINPYTTGTWMMTGIAL